MFIWNLVSITAGVIVLIILLAISYIVLAGLLEGARNALARSRKERDEQIQKADWIDRR
ncbi:hypothetical protein [Streptococcus cristatus]|jgi:hypothetical protein|uniref:Uncharacterized protein n=1 Tax=Streptococcus cristatus TaxID=45634 RepID=A0A3R9KCY4_STRCR|nr:hypothetical protein [Streptococcus cristatus]RSJ80038.1 hypothetical protein D8791_08795 [Streptococcus cristatus]